MATPFHSIDDAIKDIKKGKFVILIDDEDRENEGDLVMAASKVTPQAVNFMARHARGLICLTLTPERVEELQLPPQAVENTATFGTAFTVSIDARKGITTGISAADRATTIHVAIDPHSKPCHANHNRSLRAVTIPDVRRGTIRDLNSQSPCVSEILPRILLMLRSVLSACCGNQPTSGQP